MDYGLFLPSTNGYFASATAPHQIPTFELNKELCRRAEGYGFKLALSLVKLRGFGGVTEHWDYSLDSFSLMAGLAAVTENMKFYASVATPTLHPAMVARMAATIDSIAPGRFGVNIVAGWNKSEYQQMGLWPGDEFYEFRYDYASEYASILRQLWTEGRSDFQGRFFQLDDCVCKPVPIGHIELVSAGASERGRLFTAEHCEFNFTSGDSGVEGLAAGNRSLRETAAAFGRTAGTYIAQTVILGETDEDADRKVRLYDDGVDVEAFANIRGQAALDVKSTGTAALTNARRADLKVVDGRAIVGGPETVAQRLNEIGRVSGAAGIFLTFDDFLPSIDLFGSEVAPLLD